MLVNGDRLLATLNEINSFGAREGDGVQRLAWAADEIAARAWLADRCREQGLDVDVDEAGNVWAFAGRRPAVLLGSHLDTVPRAGRFDGALGIAAALEAVTAARDAGLDGWDRLGLICFTDEEGVRFGLGMTGSRAVAGGITEEEIRTAVAFDGTRLADVLVENGYDPGLVARAAQRRGDMAAYLELHVEQGRRLERAGIPVGIVTGIVGLRHLHVLVTGEPNHAGTTLPEDRRDALVPVAAAVLAAQRVTRENEEVVATVGRVEVEDGAENIVPGRARFSLDSRSPDEDTLEAAIAAVMDAVHRTAGDNGCEVHIDETKRLRPVPMTERVVGALRGAALEAGVDAPEMSSMAGHDAMSLASAGIGCGMVFVRSTGGISHSPAEHSRDEDCAAGADVLLRGALRLTGTLV